MSQGVAVAAEVTRAEPRRSGRTPAGEVKISLSQVDRFEFRIRFDGTDWEEMVVDEPPPLGAAHGPNSPRMLAAAIGNCLAASLLFSFQRADVPVYACDGEVTASLYRNEDRLLRVGSVRVHLRPHTSDAGATVASCLASFEDFCVVTQSVRDGIEVTVDVQPVCDGFEGPTA